MVRTPMDLHRHLVALSLAFASTACAGAPGGRAAAPVAAAEIEPIPETTAEIAREIVDGRAGALFEVRRFRFHPSAATIGRLALFGPAMKAVGLDPIADSARVFVCSSHALSAEGIAVIELERDDRAVAGLLRAAGAPGPRDATFPWTIVSLPRKERRVVALVRPGLLVVASTAFQRRLDALRVRSRLPRIPGEAAARFFSFQPSWSLGSTPRWPDTIGAAHAELEFTDDAGAVIRFFAESTTEAQAAEDAAALTKEAHALLAVDLALFEMHLLDPPRFASSGRRVTMQTRLLPSDVDWILGFTGSQ